MQAEVQIFSMQKSNARLLVVLFSVVMFMPLLSQAYSSSSPPPPLYSSYGSPPPQSSLLYIQESTDLQAAPESNLTLDSTISFVTPEIRINYPATWNALPGIPTSPYVDSVVTFSWIPQYDNISNSSDSMAILNIARHGLFHESVLLEEYVGTQLYFLRNTIPGFNLLQFNKTTLDGRPAYEAVYTGLEGTDTTQTMKLWVSSGSSRYIVTYSANAENFAANLDSARNMIGSLKIVGAQANLDMRRIGEILDHVPLTSREKVLMFANGPVLNSVFDDTVEQFIEEDSNMMPPSNFTRVPVYGAATEGSNITAYSYISPTYLSPKSESQESSEPYKLLVLIFRNGNNITNESMTEPPLAAGYKLKVNGTNFNFEENVTTETGVDIKILNGTSFVEALRNPQQYSIGLAAQSQSQD